jgi:hypothetical protein
VARSSSTSSAIRAAATGGGEGMAMASARSEPWTTSSTTRVARYWLISISPTNRWTSVSAGTLDTTSSALAQKVSVASTQSRCSIDSFRARLAMWMWGVCSASTIRKYSAAVAMRVGSFTSPSTYSDTVLNARAPWATSSWTDHSPSPGCAHWWSSTPPTSERHQWADSR